jgi:hypothetical protein
VVCGLIFWDLVRQDLIFFCIVRTVQFGMKLYNDQRNAQVLINLSIYFCLTCFGLSFSPSSEAGVQFQQWFKSPGYGVTMVKPCEFHWYFTIAGFHILWGVVCQWSGIQQACEKFNSFENRGLGNFRTCGRLVPICPYIHHFNLNGGLNKVVMNSADFLFPALYCKFYFPYLNH